MRALLAALLALAGPEAGARTLAVGAGQAFASLGEAVRAAGDGDTVRLEPGELFECAVVTQRNLVLEGSGPGTVLSDRACEGKAVLVVRGDNLTVRDLVLARARVADMNGAGIRLEGQGLTLERVGFVNNQVGVLAAAAGPGRIRVADCTFERGGVAGERATAALMVGGVAALVVERSVFSDVKGGQVRSAAGRTELVGNRISTGVEAGAGPAVLVEAGMLEMQGNVLQLGPHAPERGAAVIAAGVGAELHVNRLENQTGRPQVLLLDWMVQSPVLEGNVVGAGDSLVSTSNSWRHRAGGMVREMRGAAGSARRALLGALGR